jgi:Flp pilus assembly protein TadB
MDQLTISAATVLAATTGHTFSIGPWIIVPIMIVAAAIGTPIYIVRDRRRRRAATPESASHPMASSEDVH